MARNRYEVTESTYLSMYIYVANVYTRAILYTVTQWTPGEGRNTPTRNFDDRIDKTIINAFL